MITTKLNDGSTLLLGWQQRWLVLLYCDHHEIDPLIIQNHYSHTVSKNRFASFGVFYEGVLSGAVQLGYGIRPKSKQKWGAGVNHTNSLEFDRLWLADGLPKHSATIVISMVHKIIKRDYPHIRYILSYADGFCGYRGTIYKAAGYKELAPIVAEMFCAPDGKRYHPVSMYHRFKSRSKAVVESHMPGVILCRSKHRRFIYYL